MILEEMYFMPRRVWTEPSGEVRVTIRNETHRVASALRLVHGRFEPVAELVTVNLATGVEHRWTPMPFPAQK